MATDFNCFNCYGGFRFRFNCGQPNPPAIGRWCRTDKKRLSDRQLRDTTISAQRGTIYDRNMKPLAQSATVWKVVLAPAYIDKDDETLRRKLSTGLADILGLDAEDIYKRTEGTSYYDVLKTKVETDVKDRLVQFIEENDLGNTIQLQEDYKRYYPFGSFASTILGFTGTDGQGLAGLEALL